jgi:hypothetical protein
VLRLRAWATAQEERCGERLRWRGSAGPGRRAIAESRMERRWSATAAVGVRGSRGCSRVGPPSGVGPSSADGVNWVPHRAQPHRAWLLLFAARKAPREREDLLAQMAAFSGVPTVAGPGWRSQRRCSADAAGERELGRAGVGAAASSGAGSKLH